MKTCAVICEYNPFHNGHKYQLNRLREMGFECIVAIMSGNLVERGEPAVFDKFVRAKTALLGGADMVAELPSVYAMAPAPVFAKAGVSLAARLGCDALAFGSECGSLEALTTCMDRLDSPEAEESVKAHLAAGLSYPAARAAAYETVYGKNPLLENPNDILGMEYLRAIRSGGYDITPVVIERMGVEHDGDLTNGNYASASYLREQILTGQWRTALPFLPNTTAVLLKECEKKGAVSRIAHLEKPLLAAVRSLSAKDWLTVAGVGDGLEFRLFHAALRASSLEELYKTAKTKRFPMARIKRAVLSAYFGITEEMQQASVPYLRVLGMSAVGETFLRGCSTDGIPIVLRASELKGHPLFELECRITDRYVLTFDKPLPCGTELTARLIKQ